MSFAVGPELGAFLSARCDASFEHDIVQRILSPTVP